MLLRTLTHTTYHICFCDISMDQKKNKPEIIFRFPLLTGFSAVIPGFPRYSVLGDRTQGVYNLKISNASLDDDAEYQCQVGPAKLNSAIRANAKLTVICKYSCFVLVIEF